jgi:glycosyltransferase involved in cell wall biosynthesis
MKIIIVQDYLRCGGTENQSIFLHNFLNQRGIDTTLLTFRPKGRLKDRIENLDKWITLQNIDTSLNWFAPKLLSTAKKINPDIILLMGRNANLYGWLLNQKLPSTTHVISTMRSGRKLPWFYKKSLSECPITLCNSDFALSCLHKKRIFPRRAQVIHNAFLYPEVEPVQPKQNEKLILLNVAAYVPGKNHKEWIPIIKKWETTMQQDYELWLLGEGPEFEKFKALVNEQNLNHRIKILGFQDNPVSFYQKADIAISISLEESLPNFLVEAQFLGLPVVSYDTAGCKECFSEGESGYLVPQRDTTLFCQKVIDLAKDTKLRNQMSQASREFAKQNFSQESIGKQYLKLFGELQQN